MNLPRYLSRRRGAAVNTRPQLVAAMPIALRLRRLPPRPQPAAVRLSEWEQARRFEIQTHREPLVAQLRRRRRPQLPESPSAAEAERARLGRQTAYKLAVATALPADPAQTAALEPALQAVAAFAHAAAPQLLVHLAVCAEVAISTDELALCMLGAHALSAGESLRSTAAAAAHDCLDQALFDAYRAQLAMQTDTDVEAPSVRQVGEAMEACTRALAALPAERLEAHGVAALRRLSPPCAEALRPCVELMLLPPEELAALLSAEAEAVEAAYEAALDRAFPAAAE